MFLTLGTSNKKIKHKQNIKIGNFMRLKFRFPISDSELIKFLLSKVVSQYVLNLYLKKICKIY